MSKENYKLAASAVPTERQISWQDTEFNALISFGLGTFTGRDNDEGFTVPEQFYPVGLDTDTWGETVKTLGCSGLIMTAKHTDGFCNFRTATTSYSCTGTNWLDGKGDVVKMAELSARKQGLRFGVSYALCDKHEINGGTTEAEYNSLIQRQVEELTTNYGELFEFLLDDRCDIVIPFGIDFGEIYRIIRENQPSCAITFRGPDARQVGNNLGVTRKNEYSSLPVMYGYNEDGTTNPDTEKVKHGQMNMDLGSRKAIKHSDKFGWYPCEVYYPSRRHRFYKKDDDYSSKTKDKILKVYEQSVGNNANLLFDIAPDKFGKFTDTETQVYSATGKDLKILFGYNLLKDSQASSSSDSGDLFKAENVKTDDNRFWMPSADDKEPTLEITFDKPEMFDKVVIKENIASGEHVEEFTVYIMDNEKKKWRVFYEGGNIGHKHICHIKACETDRVKIVFTKFRATPEIKYVLIN